MKHSQLLKLYSAQLLLLAADVAADQQMMSWLPSATGLPRQVIDVEIHKAPATPLAMHGSLQVPEGTF
jgi:hypothetical protein